MISEVVAAVLGGIVGGGAGGYATYWLTNVQANKDKDDRRRVIAKVLSRELRGSVMSLLALRRIRPDRDFVELHLEMDWMKRLPDFASLFDPKTMSLLSDYDSGTKTIDFLRRRIAKLRHTPEVGTPVSDVPKLEKAVRMFLEHTIHCGVQAYLVVTDERDLFSLPAPDESDEVFLRYERMLLDALSNEQTGSFISMLTRKG